MCVVDVDMRERERERRERRGKNEVVESLKAFNSLCKVLSLPVQMLSRQQCTWRSLLETASQGIVNFHKEPGGTEYPDVTRNHLATSSNYITIDRL